MKNVEKYDTEKPEWNFISKEEVSLLKRKLGKSHRKESDWEVIMRKKILFVTLSIVMFLVLCSCDSKPIRTTATSEGEDAGNEPQWGPELFKDPATKYNNDLAYIAAILSDRAEDTTGENIKNQYSKYGINSCKTYKYTSKKEIFGVEAALEGGAFAIGQDTFNIDGVDTTVLVITARGSKTAGEFIGDLWKGEYLDPDKVHSFLDRTVWDNVYDFEEQLWEGFNKYIKDYPAIQSAENMKILITGHSLGGAAASMFGARITNGVGGSEWWGDKLSQDDIYVYTFGAIKVLTTDDNVSAGYENIHNIYNHYDSFGPNGNLGFTEASSIHAKFGHTEEYCHDHTQDASNGKDISLNHNMSSYIKDLEKNLIIDAPCGSCEGSNSCLHSSESIDSGAQIAPSAPADDFSIRGTWKNVGDTTFGQAQSESIIIFDGTHCNYFSPCDTYAFYYENGQWTLDCASYIFADTLRFRVDIIDEDSIDIFYGSDAVRLNRISRDADVIEEPDNIETDFALEGSWLSIGNTGFGQAQPGITVTFDGTHCNFFSPYDTYAFYQEDGQWKLECTSFLFSDTLTFTVEIIDLDRINIYYGSTCTELQRTN